MAISSREKLKDDVFLGIAWRVGTLSTCNRAEVGAVITHEGRAVSWGFNGAPPGMPHCEHTDDEPCERAIHAELNAVCFAAREGISTANGTLYVTISPCLKCAQTLLAAGIVRVCYDELYRDSAGLDLLDNAGVEIVRP